MPAHVASAYYGVPRFRAEPDYLSDVVRFDLPLLGDVAGPARRASAVPHRDRHGVPGPAGRVDDRARLLRGRRSRRRRGSPPRPGRRDVRPGRRVRRAADVLGAGAFDLVYTGIGALCWLPDIRRWAGVVAALLRPGGRLFLREGHPMLWTIDDARRRPAGRKYPYFEQPEPLTWTEGGTYVDTDAVFDAERQPRVEPRPRRDRHRPVRRRPRAHRPGRARQRPVEPPPRQDGADCGSEWRLADNPARLPFTYTLQAVKPPR